MKTIQLKWTGLRPILMNNPQSVSITNPYSVESRKINAASKVARKKSDEDLLAELHNRQLKNDFMASSYWRDGDFVLPDTIIIAVLKSAAQASKKGKDIDRAVIMTETEAIIKTKRRFKSLEDAFSDETFRFESPCRVPPKTGSLVWKARCKIPSGWSVTFNLEFDETLITSKTLADISETAGRLVGVGAWRPNFGRFESEVVS